MFKLIIPKQIEKDMKSFPKEQNILILKKIEELKNGVFLGDKSLKVKYKGRFRKRAGDYRIIYLKENDILLITLIRIAHRKEVY